MRCRLFGLIMFSTLAMPIMGRLGPFPAVCQAQAETPKEPQKAVSLESPLNPKAAPVRPFATPGAPPEEPVPADGGLAQFIATTDQAIEFFQSRVKRNTQDVMSYRHLGEMHERKARQTGDLVSYARAEAAFRKSLELRPDEPRAEAGLAAVLCSQHRFVEGLAIARKLCNENPSNIDALSTLGDALLELGQYPEAEKTFQELLRLAAIPEVLARLANLAELKGNTEEAVSLMRQATGQIQKGSADPKAAAWFQARLGDIHFNAGRIEDAAKLYELVPAGTDAHHDATAALGRIRAIRGQTEEAIELYKKAVSIGPDPHMLAALGDLYIKAGHPENAVPLFDQLLKITKGKPEYLRERAMFLANHDRDLSDALALAREDLLQRKDIHGYDALAWTLYKNGQTQDAAKAIDQALKLGTVDANLFFHAGMIHNRLGNREKARDFLTKCLRLNPNFSVLHAEEAKKTLKSLE